jgi:hypothetical protein
MWSWRIFLIIARQRKTRKAATDETSPDTYYQDTKQHSTKLLMSSSWIQFSIPLHAICDSMQVRRLRAVCERYYARPEAQVESEWTTHVEITMSTFAVVAL